MYPNASNTPYLYFRMDFALESWEVSSEANVLADNLFGQQKSEVALC